MSRKLIASPARGIISPASIVPTTHVNAKFYTRPSTVLTRLDEVRAGHPPTICITRSQGGIGDVLMTLPTVKAISQKYQCKIDYGTDTTYLGGALPAVLQYIPNINRVFSYQDVEPELYSAILDLTCPCIAHEQPKAPPINRIDLFARHAGLVLTDRQIDYFIQDEEKQEAHRKLSQRRLLTEMGNTQLILVQPSSSTSRRDLPIPTLQHIIRNVVMTRGNVRVLVLTHSSDGPAAKETDWALLPNTTILKDQRVREIAAIMHFANLLVCPDSALLHLAGAIGKETFTFFGPTDARARVNYYPKAVAIWPGQYLSCCPCWYAACKVGSICWKQIDEQLATRTIIRLLDRQPPEDHRDLVFFNNTQGDTVNYEVL